MTPIIIGVCHGDDVRRVLDEYGQKKFAQEICPIIDNNTLLVLEGRYSRNLFHPKHEQYERELRRAKCCLGTTFSASPSILWRDPRMFPLHRAVISAQFADYLENLLRRIPQPGLTCRSFAELLRRVERGIPPHISKKRQLSSRQKMLLWWNAKEMREFDRRMIAAIKKYRDTHQVIVLCGMIHALAIAGSEGGILKSFVRDTRVEAHDTIRQYHAAYVLPPYFPVNFRVR